MHCEDSHRENLLAHFDKTFEFVHCQAGISRSPMIVIGYLMKLHQKTFEQACTLVKSKRSIINPNWNFRNQLARDDQMLNERSF